MTTHYRSRTLAGDTPAYGISAVYSHILPDETESPTLCQSTSMAEAQDTDVFMPIPQDREQISMLNLLYLINIHTHVTRIEIVNHLRDLRD